MGRNDKINQEFYPMPVYSPSQSEIFAKYVFNIMDTGEIKDYSIDSNGDEISIKFTISKEKLEALEVKNG
jgi:hypothetical protein